MCRSRRCLPKGYRVNASTVPAHDSVFISQFDLEVHRSRAADRHDGRRASANSGSTTTMIYDRAKLMYGHLRDVHGRLARSAPSFTSTTAAGRSSTSTSARCERPPSAVYGKSLGWFFDQWVHGTGLMDYALRRRRARRRRTGASRRPCVSSGAAS